MELIYSWINKYRTYEDVELNFSNKFLVDYNRQENTITITRNKNYCSLYEEHISNINLIVGKNSAGKTNLLDMIGIRNGERNRNEDEWEDRLKNGKRPKGLHKAGEVISIKKSVYFYIYYFGQDDKGQDLYCIEGNDIDSFINLFNADIDLQENYRREKYWFPFICTNSNGKLNVLHDLNYPIKQKISKINGFKYEETEKDSLAIISLREDLNTKNYDNYSIKPVDEQRVCIPRRISIFNSRLLENKIVMLYNQINNHKRTMFTNDNYVVEISYYDFIDNKDKVIFQSFKELEDENSRKICSILESFIYKYYNSICKKSDVRAKIEEKIKKINIDKSVLDNYIDYYKKIIRFISYDNFNDKDDEEYAIKCFDELCYVLCNTYNISFEDHSFKININKDCNIDEITRFIKATVDQMPLSVIEEKFYMFHDFFEWQLYDMSDGEKAFLGLFAAMYEQISQLTPGKDKYILLLDEPEARMHPELARMFISYLIEFLKDISEGKKKFQVIISTHSPFILSDIPDGNIIYLEKDKEGHTKSLNRQAKTFGANIHSLLKDSFFMNSTIGEYSKEKINDIIKALKPIKKDKKTGRVKYKSKESILKLLNIDSIEDIRKLIDMIGEPIIKLKLKEMYDSYIKNSDSDLYKKELQNKISKLQQELSSLNKE